MYSWWANLPLMIDPVALSAGNFFISWYAVFFIAGAVIASLVLRQSTVRAGFTFSLETYFTFLSYLLWGAVIGARLGFIFFYGDISDFLTEPWRIFSPYDIQTGVWTGVRGMSFLGGLLGGLFGLVLYAYKYNTSFTRLADMTVVALPLALFFGRLGNFMNGELIGRATTSPLGMHFPSDPAALRHPSQLYEALGEGVFLFALLLFLRRFKLPAGSLSLIFLSGYGGMRFALEYLREPDLGATLFFNVVTFNQLWAGLLFLVALSILIWDKRLWYTKNTP